jgi:hypothetical protein
MLVGMDLPASESPTAAHQGLLHERAVILPKQSDRHALQVLVDLRQEVIDRLAGSSRRPQEQPCAAAVLDRHPVTSEPSALVPGDERSSCGYLLQIGRDAGAHGGFIPEAVVLLVDALNASGEVEPTSGVAPPDMPTVGTATGGHIRGG